MTQPGPQRARVAAPAQTTMPDEIGRDLIEGCKRAERRSQQRLYELLYPRLMNVCLRYTRDEEDARSHFMQGFLKILTNMERYAYEGAFESWASRVMINSVIDDLRRRKAYTQRVTHVDADKLEQADDVDWNAFELKANADDVLGLVKQLPDATRSVFLLYGVDGYAHKEIAAMLNISEGTSKWHVAEARKRLTALLAETYNYIHTR